MSVNLSHRHSSYDPKQPDLINAYDDIHIMNERVTAAIHLIQNELLGDRTLDDSVLFVALETARMELQDINSLLSHLVDFQLKKNKNAP